MMGKVLGIEFAPLRLPLERRLQTLAVLFYCSQFLVIGFCCCLIMVALLFTKYYCVTLLYSLWWYIDRHTSSRGGRTGRWARKWRLWQKYRDYFPVSLVKTAELDPTKNYIFGVHPHGIMSFGAFLNFGTEGTFFSRLFPGIRPYPLTLEAQFKMPVHRELIMMTGACSATWESMQWLLTKEGTGNALVLIVGGAVEALDAVPGCLEITLSPRKGFVKLALQHGASLVPVISFGENDVLDQKHRDENTWVKQMQKKVTRVAGFSPPLFHGRGIFQYTFGLLPFRRPIVTVVGKPIDVQQDLSPSRETVEALHNRYVESLVDLFNQFKDKYGSEKLKLVIK